MVKASSTTNSSPSLDPLEVEKFSKLASEWWDPTGKFAVLHKFNPFRLAYIREQVTARFLRDPFASRPYQDLDVLDIGCGGGLLSEPVARLGARVTAIDPSEENIRTAMVHAEEHVLDIDYRVATAEQLVSEERRFDVILNMEVVEHVRRPADFLTACASLLRPEGLLFTATISRTFKSFLLAIIGAEYVLRWLPQGTHHWESFITPDELDSYLQSAGLRPIETLGVVYNPLQGTWQRSRDTGVNYLTLATKPAAVRPS
jgi:2-polyprenyl-6-hydroxyphenyl methylase / 3-demethylubiquinone-9 3-methyltransferase